MRVDLEDGAWIEVRDASSITNRERREYKNRVIPEIADQVAREKGCPVDEVGDATLSVRVAEALVDRLIVGWSFGLPLPSHDPAVWDSDLLPFEVWDRALEAATPVVNLLRGGVDFDPHATPSGPDRSTPTGTSAV